MKKAAPKPVEDEFDFDAEPVPEPEPVVESQPEPVAEEKPAVKKPVKKVVNLFLLLQRNPSRLLRNLLRKL